MRTNGLAPTVVRMESSHEHFSVTSRNGITTITTVGDLDLHARKEAEELLSWVEFAGVDDLVLDLSHVGFIDSTGVSALLSLAHAVRKRYGRVRLSNAPERALFLLDVRGGLGMFERRGRMSA